MASGNPDDDDQTNCPFEEEDGQNGSQYENGDDQTNCPFEEEEGQKESKYENDDDQTNCPFEEEEGQYGSKGENDDDQTNCPFEEEEGRNGSKGENDDDQTNCPLEEEEEEQGRKGSKCECDLVEDSLSEAKCECEQGSDKQGDDKAKQAEDDQGKQKKLEPPELFLFGAPLDWPCQKDTLEYIKTHQIMELFHNLVAEIVYYRPEDPKQFSICILEKLQRVRYRPGEVPSLFDDSNLQAIWTILDPLDTGFISLVHYLDAMHAMGAVGYAERPKGTEKNQISKQTFILQA